MRTVVTSLIVAVALAVPVAWHPSAASAQNPDLRTRDMQDSALFQGRPKSKNSRPRAPRPYRRSDGTAAPRVVAAKGDTEIGITIWRMRPAEAGDPRDIVHETSDAAKVTPVRALGDEALGIGDRFRFAIESSRHGYLYVVNHPVYEGGPERPSALIFPTLRIRGGANSIGGGVLVELPTDYDTPPHYSIAQRGEGKLVAEEVIVLVTPKPLDLVIGGGPIVLSAETIAEWERLWGATAERYEFEDGAGMLYTTEELKARKDPRYRIDRDGPAPQVLFRIPERGDSPVFLRIRIPVRDDTAGEGR